MSSTMSCLWDRTKNCGDLRFYLFKNVVFVKIVAPITRLSYIPCLLIYITLCLDVTLDSARCSSLITLRVPVDNLSQTTFVLDDMSQKGAICSKIIWTICHNFV